MEDEVVGMWSGCGSGPLRLRGKKGKHKDMLQQQERRYLKIRNFTRQ